MLSSFKPCLNACSATTSLFINASNFVQRYSSRLYLRKLSLHPVVSRILQKRKGHPGDGCRPRHSRRPTDRKESNCTGSCDAEILARAQMFAQVEKRTYFRYYRHRRNTRQPCAISRHSPKAEAREHTMARLPSGRPSHACGKKPHRLRNGDAALAAAGSPRSRQTTSRTPPADERTEFQTARATSTPPRSRRQAWGPRCPDRWAAYSRR